MVNSAKQLTRAQRTRVLVADSNPINRSVIATVMMRLGHEADVVDNAHDAFDAVELTEFDYILLSLDFPDTDPTDNVVALRGLMSHKGREVPIIGLTARPDSVIPKACEEFGMAGYLTIPLKTEALEPMLAALARLRSDQLTSAGGNEVVLLEPSLLKSIRSLSNPGEADFLNTLIAMFFKRAPELFAAMDKAFAAKDEDAFERSAHALKGTCGNLGAMRMMKACEQLEHIGKAGDLSPVPPLVIKLKALYDEVRTALEREWIV